MKNFLHKLSLTKGEIFPDEGQRIKKRGIAKRLYHKYQKGFVGVILVLFLIPTMIYSRLGGENGMIFSLVLFSFIGLLALSEVMNNFMISRFGQLIVVVVFLWSVFTPFNLLVELQELSNGTREETGLGMLPFFAKAFPWYTFVAFGVGSLVFVFDHQDKITKKYQIKRYFFMVITLVVTTGMVKTMFVMSVRWTEVIILDFAIAILTDTFASVGGKLFGKKFPLKLAPKISPNKTVVGALIGIVAGTSLFLIVSYTSPIWDQYKIDTVNIDFWIWLAALGLPIIGIIGDLFFSAIKRLIGIKDFSSIISGHGGIFDRLDSHAFIFTSAGLMFMTYHYLYDYLVSL